MLISVEGTGKNWLEPDQTWLEDVSVLAHCSLLKEIFDQN